MAEGLGELASDAWVIAVKELRGIARDRRVLISITIVPLVVFPLLFGLLGAATVYSSYKVAEGRLEIMVNGSAHAPDLMAKVNETDRFAYIERTDPIASIRDEELALYVEVAPGFQTAVEGNGTGHLTIRYSSTAPRSVVARNEFLDVVDAYREERIRDRLAHLGQNVSLLDVANATSVDIATKEQRSGFLLGTVVPYFVIIQLFTGATSIGLDAVAGEKERNTLGTLLVNKVRRESIVVGKILAVMIMAFVSAFFTVGGMALAIGLPLSILAPGELGLGAIGPWTLAQLALLLLPAATFLVGLVVLAGTYARNVKEASTYLTPMYALVIGLGVVSLGIQFSVGRWIYLLPVANVIFGMREVFNAKLAIVDLLLAMGSSALYTAVLVAACVRLFRSEKVLFRV